MTETADPQPDLIVTATDVRAVGFCMSGTRRYFEANNLDFRDFLQHGIAAARLLALGDVFADRAVDKARERVNGWR